MRKAKECISQNAEIKPTKMRTFLQKSCWIMRINHLRISDDEEGEWMLHLKWWDKPSKNEDISSNKSLNDENDSS